MIQLQLFSLLFYYENVITYPKNLTRTLEALFLDYPLIILDSNMDLLADNKLQMLHVYN